MKIINLLITAGFFFILNFSINAEYGLNSQNKFLSLNGTNGYVSVPHHPSFDQASNGTIEAWVYPIQYNSGCIIAKGYPPASPSFFMFLTSSDLQFQFAGYSLGFNSVIPLLQWSHIAVTWTSSPSKRVTFYVNGTQTNFSTVNFSWNANTDPIEIGAFNNAYYFNGYIDEVRYWGTARTVSQILNNRFTGIGDGSGANSSSALVSGANYFGLISSWNFNTSGTAYDYISNYNGTFNGTTAIIGATPGYPLPYNFVLICPGGTNDYVTVPSNAAFNQNTNGTFDAWVYPISQTISHAIITRGPANHDLQWGVKQSIGNKQILEIGNIVFDNTDGTVVPQFKWTHLAVKWQVSGSNCTVTFYVNGLQSGTPVTQAAAWTSTSGSLLIGGAFSPPNNWDGYLDEIRFWSAALTQDQVRAYMFNSCRTGNMNNLIGAWNFDGNLLNYGSTSSINGSFNTGGTNNCRMSGYLNEYTPGAPSSVFTAYPTVLNRSASGNPFPGGFAVKSPDKPITDLQTTRDTITFSGNGNVTSVEVYISIAHTYPDDLDITLRAPNGTTRNLSSDNGGSNQSGIVTFFVDGESPITGTTLFPPYSNLIGPEAVMGSFGSSLVAGNWILEVYDDNTGAAGTLRGWGIRMNGALTTIELVSNNTPDRYSLSQNYPNPFNPNTKIEFRISKLGFTKLVVFDVTGREVSILVNDVLKQGTYEVDFDGSNFASGVYYYILIAGDYTETRKMMLVK